MISARLGPRFLDSVLSVSADALAAGPIRLVDLDRSLPERERRRFVAALARSDPALARDFDEMLAKHDFAGIFAGVLEDYGLSPTRLSDALAAMAAALWTAIQRAGDPDEKAVRTLAHQIAMVLESRPPSLPASAMQEMHSALACQFVVLYFAVLGARAKGDARAIDRLADLATDGPRAMFGQDMKHILLSGRGFTTAI